MLVKRKRPDGDTARPRKHRRGSGDDGWTRTIQEVVAALYGPDRDKAALLSAAAIRVRNLWSKDKIHLAVRAYAETVRLRDFPAPAGVRVYAEIQRIRACAIGLTQAMIDANIVEYADRLVCAAWSGHGVPREHVQWECVALAADLRLRVHFARAMLAGAEVLAEMIGNPEQCADVLERMMTTETVDLCVQIQRLTLIPPGSPYMYFMRTYESVAMFNLPRVQKVDPDNFMQVAYSNIYEQIQDNRRVMTPTPGEAAIFTVAREVFKAVYYVFGLQPAQLPKDAFRFYTDALPLDADELAASDYPVFLGIGLIYCVRWRDRACTGPAMTIVRTWVEWTAEDRLLRSRQRD